MRHFRLYHSDPWLDTSDISLETLCREIFRNERGCFDGYEKIWEKVRFTWGDEKLGGVGEVRNCRLETARVKIKAWDKDEKRFFEAEEEFWNWYQLYKSLSSIVWDFTPNSRYYPIHKHDVQVIADFYSFLFSFDPDEFDEEVVKLYKEVITRAPWGATIFSDDNKPYIEIYLDCDRYQFKTEDGKFMFYLPTIEEPSHLKEFMELILSEPYDRDAEVET